MQLKKIYKNNKVLIISLTISISCYVIYVLTRGFGWDGDSFISASQFQKLIGSDLYGMIDGGAHPKLLSILLFGIVYELSGGFFLLTVIAIVLNTLMIMTITFWINQGKGVWLIALVGILINIPWTKIVVNCDNPAFSIPFIVFGLYNISKEKLIKGAIFLTISSLFRTGAEFIIIFILFKQLYNKNLRNTILFFTAFALSAIHAVWGYMLIYQSRELFWELAWEFLTTTSSIEMYKHSFNALIPYLNSIAKQIFNKYSILFIVPSIIGLVKLFKTKTKILYVLFIPLGSLIYPISSFIYGTAHEILETKHMGYTILLPVLAAFSIKNSIFDQISSKTRTYLTSGILFIVILFSAFTGTIKHGDYETHVNGTGRSGWVNFPEIKQEMELIQPSEKLNILTVRGPYLTFILLDVGKYAKNIDVTNNAIDIDYSIIDKYDLIVLPKTWNVDSIRMSNLGFVIKLNINKSYIYYISHSLQL